MTAPLWFVALCVLMVLALVAPSFLRPFRGDVLREVEDGPLRRAQEHGRRTR